MNLPPGCVPRRSTTIQKDDPRGGENRSPSPSPHGRTRMIVVPARRSVALKAAAASSRVEKLSQVLFPVASVCGLRAPRTVNRVAPRASTPYPKAICGSEKVLESLPEMRLGNWTRTSGISCSCWLKRLPWVLLDEQPSTTPSPPSTRCAPVQSRTHRDWLLRRVKD